MVKAAPKTEKTETVKTDLPHGRKAGPDGSLCGHCLWIDSGNTAIGNPPGLGCRIVRNVKNATQSCHQFSPKGAAEHPDSPKVKASRKKFGVLAQKMHAKQVGDCITTGSYYVDLITGGGISGGKLVVYFGPEHSGKTSLCFKSAAAALARRIPVYGWDAEESWDDAYIKAAGVDIKDPLFKTERFPNGDAFYDHMVGLLSAMKDRDSGPPQMLVIVDSAAAFVARMTMEDPSKSGMVSGPSAVHSRGLPKIKGLLGQKKVSLIATNHVGQKPGSAHGNPEYERGGDALKFYSDMRLRIAKRASNGQGDTKLLPPFFRGDDKGALVKEKSWTGSGIDKYGYAAVGVRKNKGFSGGQNGVVRICTRGPAEAGLDLAYDLFQCLVATGQAEWLGKNRVGLNLLRPVFKDGELKFVKVRGFYDVSMTWLDFKKIIFGSKPGPNIEEIWQSQMASGWAIARFLEVQNSDGEDNEEAEAEAEESDASDDQEEE